MNRLLRVGLGGEFGRGNGAIPPSGQARPFPSGDVRKTYERFLKQIDAIPHV